MDILLQIGVTPRRELICTVIGPEADFPALFLRPVIHCLDDIAKVTATTAQRLPGPQ